MAVPDDAPVISTRFPAAAYAMATALREWSVATGVSAICLHKGHSSAW